MNYKKITKAEKAIINESNKYTLYEWYDKLNSWEWPKELLPEEDPKKYGKGSVRRKLIKLIDEKVGRRYLLRQHNKDMPEDVFNEFWVNNSESKIFMDYLREECKKDQRFYSNE